MRLIGFVCPSAVSIALLATATCSRGSQSTAARDGSAGNAASATTPGSEVGQVDASGASCPDDMVFVNTTFCPDVERHCTDMEKEHRNHLDICHAFASEQTCRDQARSIAFCIDRYEYPNQKGARPARMLDWYQAQATCEANQKRLCWASEWTAACEGPEHTPFPYGWARDHDACNMDNFYIDPKRPGPKGQFFFYSKDRRVAASELARLDQSVPCGSMESCKSGFGVYDMTGNVDEWVSSDQPPRERSKWAGLKGGAWGHVRSQCRPMTTSHEPEFTYYFVGFRCCRDALEPGAPKWLPSPLAATPPPVEPHDFARERSNLASAPGPSKAKFSRTGKPE
jgi:sulfatase modifying factor 1